MIDIDEIALETVKAIGNIDPDKLKGGKTQAMARAQCYVIDAIKRCLPSQSGQGAEPVGSLKSCACQFDSKGELLKECLFHQTRYKPQQGSVPEGEERLADVYRRQLFECQDELNNLRSEYHNRTAELETEIEDLQEDLQRVRRQPAQQGSVPEGWHYVVEVFLENVEEVTELLLAGGDADNIVALCNDLNKAATVAEKILATPQPEGDGWIKCSERLPTEEDADFRGDVWVNDKAMSRAKYQQCLARWNTVGQISDYTHWKPTGLTRPAAPDMGGDE